MDQYNIAVTSSMVIPEVLVKITTNSAAATEIYNFEEIYLAAYYAKKLGMDIEKLRYLIDWSEPEEDDFYSNYQYIYYVNDILPGMLEYSKALSVNYIIENFHELLKKPRHYGLFYDNDNKFYEMLKFYESFNFATLFEELNDETRWQIDLLNIARKKCADSFLLSPYANIADMVHTPSDARVWSCAPYTKIAPVAPGESVIAEYSIERIHEATCDLLRRPLNRNTPDAKFPHDGVAICGGLPTALVYRNYEYKNHFQSDIDLFVFGPDMVARKATYVALLNWFKKYDADGNVITYYFVNGSVTSIYVRDINKKIQIITGLYTNIYEILTHFDFTHVQWAIWNWKFLGTPSAHLALKRRTTETCRADIKAMRLFKALRIGYNVVWDAEVNKSCEIDLIIQEESQSRARTIMRGLFDAYFPRRIPELEYDDECENIMCTIEKLNASGTTSTDVNDIIEKVKIDGNFDSYHTITCESFNFASIRYTQGKHQQVVSTKLGPITLESPQLEVVSVAIVDGDVKFKLRNSSHQFAEFCDIMDDNVKQFFTRWPGTQRLMVDDLIECVIDENSLDRKQERGLSYLYDANGQCLSFDDGLARGDMVTMVFQIKKVRVGNRYVFAFSVIRMRKI